MSPNKNKARVIRRKWIEWQLAAWRKGGLVRLTLPGNPFSLGEPDVNLKEKFQLKRNE